MPEYICFTVHFVGTDLAAVRENLPTSRRGKFCVSRVVGDADPYGLRRKNTAPVGNAVLSVPHTIRNADLMIGFAYDRLYLVIQ